MSDEMENFPLSIFGSAARSALGMVAGFFLTCWVGVLIVMLCSGGGVHFVELWYMPVAWIVSAFLSLFQGWGLITYGLIVLCGIHLVYTEGPRRHAYFTVLIIQTIESARFAWSFDFASVNLLAVGIVVAALIALYVTANVLVQLAWKRDADRLATRSRNCRKCGYDLRGTIGTGGTTCPECGESILHAQPRQNRL